MKRGANRRAVGRGRVIAAFALVGLALALYGAVNALGANAGMSPVFEAVEAQSLNWRFRLRGPVEPGDETVVVMIDDRTVAALGEWPLSRIFMALAVEALAADGARVIAFDLLFVDPEPTPSAASAPALRAIRDRLAGTAPQLAASIDRLLGFASPDDAFAAALASSGRVVVPFAFGFAAGGGNAAAPDAVARSAYSVYHLPAGRDPMLPVRPSTLLAPVPSLAEASSTAHVNVMLEGDGGLRYEHPVIGYGDAIYPSLPIEAVRLYAGVAKDDVTVVFGDGIALGDRFVPTDRDMRMPINHYGPAGTFETHAFIDLIEGKVPDGTFSDRIVIVGNSVLGAGDRFVTPYTSTLPGAEHYATVIDNILHGRMLVRSDQTMAIGALAIAVGSVAAAALAMLCPPAVAGFAILALLAGWSAVNALAFSRAGLWLDYVLPTGSIALSYGCFAVAAAVRDRRSRRAAERERRNLARYVPSTVVDALADSDRPFALDRTQYAAVMFVDIVGFTRFSERLAPDETMALLRDFLGRVEHAVGAHNGTVKNFQGDGALASFGVPEAGPADASDALLCARALAAEVASWGDERAAAGKPRFAIGIGLNYGPVRMGEIGGRRQFQFTVTGDTVNVASRLEALTRTLGATIIVSDALVEAARAGGGGAALDGFVELPPQDIRGRDRQIGVWAWPGPETSADDAA